jgi:hypothetical protein
VTRRRRRSSSLIGYQGIYCPRAASTQLKIIFTKICLANEFYMQRHFSMYLSKKKKGDTLCAELVRCRIISKREDNSLRFFLITGNTSMLSGLRVETGDVSTAYGWKLEI